jgi:Rrf2 family protein
MKISTKGRYVLRVMIDIARNGGTEEYIPLAMIAERQAISKKYLESILVILTRAGFLDGVRGKGGGYRLTKAPEEYTVGSILLLVEDSLAPVVCMTDASGKCSGTECCTARRVWEGLDRVVYEYLNGITLADILSEPLPH